MQVVTDPSAAIEQLNTAVTENSAQRTKDCAIIEQTVTVMNAAVFRGGVRHKVERHARWQGSDARSEAAFHR